MKQRIKPISYFLIAVLFLSVAGFSAVHLFDGLQYKAEKIGSDKNIDRSLRNMAKEGWYPKFILKFEGDARLLYQRPREASERQVGLNYKAVVIGSGKKIDDTFNKMASEGWVPRFVFRTGALNQNWRIILEQDPAATTAPLEYRAELILQGRDVDDKFNQLSADGWYPLFVIEGTTDLRMLFARDPKNKERTVKFMAKTARNIKNIDDLYNEHGKEGWEPIFLFKDESSVYRSLFKQSVLEAPVRREYQARRIEEISEIDDKFTQYGADGWYPVFVIKDVEEVLQDAPVTPAKPAPNTVQKPKTVENVRWRMLFGRVLE